MIFLCHPRVVSNGIVSTSKPHQYEADFITRNNLFCVHHIFRRENIFLYYLILLGFASQFHFARSFSQLHFQIKYKIHEGSERVELFALLFPISRLTRTRANEYWNIMPLHTLFIAWGSISALWNVFGCKICCFRELSEQASRTHIFHLPSTLISL